jgi:hypothetical protein
MLQPKQPKRDIVAPVVPLLTLLKGNTIMSDLNAAEDATVAVEVPTEHETLVQRVLALLENDATWLKDNIEAGLTHFEGLFKSDDDAPPAA